MKITNNEIMVELPEEQNNRCSWTEELISDYSQGFNQGIKNVKQLNPPRVVDVEALTEIMYEENFNDALGYREMCNKISRHLAANLDKWLIEKKEDRTV